MYEPFPGNYVWNLSVNLALCMGGQMGEIDPANDEVRDIARQGADEGTGAFFDSWGKLAERLVMLGEECEAAGHGRSAAEKYRRAVAYYVTAERMQARTYLPRQQMYRTMIDTAARAIREGGSKWERVEIPFEGKSFPALFLPGEGRGPRPTMVFCNGLDSVKEMIALAIGDTFAERGISVLAVDQPGVGEALRLQKLSAIYDSERWASAALDVLLRRPDVEGGKIGMMGWSLGGYFAPRAAIYEPRFRLCVAWGANHDWGELQSRRLHNEGENPVPHYWEHVMWVWGQPDMADFMALMPKVTLNGHMDEMRVPFLIVHGANDRQIPREYAHQSYDQAVNSPDRELKFFTDREGGVEHCSADNMEPVKSYIADWIADRFARMA